MQTVSLDKFPLKWRWTEEKYALFSETELSQIAPLDIASAKDVWESSLKFVSNSNDFSPRTDLFVDIERIEASDENAARNWLAARLPQCNIVVS